MYYICLENNIIINILNYQPAVPESVTVHSISDDDYKSIRDGINRFNVETLTVEPVPAEQLAIKETERLQTEKRIFLSNSDWKIMRHIREKALGLTTSITENEYLNLEQQRQDIAKSI